MTLLPPPMVPVFPAGFGPAPSDMDSLIQDTLGFQTTGIVFRAHQTIGQSLTNGSYVNLKFDTVDEDPYGGWSSTSTGSQAANSWLAPYTGWFQVTFTWNYTPATSGYSESAVEIDGILTYDLGQTATFSGGQGSYIVPLTGTVDYIQMQAKINQNGLTTNVSTAGFQPSCEITFISQ